MLADTMIRRRKLRCHRGPLKHASHSSLQREIGAVGDRFAGICNAETQVQQVINQRNENCLLTKHVRPNVYLFCDIKYLLSSQRDVSSFKYKLGGA